MYYIGAYIGAYIGNDNNHMIGIQQDLNLDAYIKDKTLNIDKNHLQNMCKKNQGEKTCRYIMLSNNGYVCVKNTAMKKSIDILCDKEQMTARGDNCDGLGDKSAEKEIISSEKDKKENNQEKAVENR